MRQEGGDPLSFALKFLGHQSENKQMKPFVPEEKNAERTAQTHRI